MTMKPTQKLGVDAQFFFAHAGYSYGMGETPAQGRTRCALNLAAAESFARAAGLSFKWTPDDEPNEWACLLHDSAGRITHSLGGIGFANDGEPWDGDTYRRVVEAELSAEHMHEVMNAAKVA